MMRRAANGSAKSYGHSPTIEPRENWTRAADAGTHLIGREIGKGTYRARQPMWGAATPHHPALIVFQMVRRGRTLRP